MASSDDIVGAILAGGRSRRFGGGDKGFAELAGRSVLTRIIERFGPQVAHLIINANGDRSRFNGYGLEIVADSEYPENGPLSGVLAALDWAKADGFGTLVTVTTDVPFLPLDLVERLRATSGGRIALAVSAGRRHPTIALWPADARAAIAAALARRSLGVDALAANLNAVAVTFPMLQIGDVEIDPFFNVNTRADLATARSLIAATVRDNDMGNAPEPHVPTLPLFGIAGWSNAGKTTLIEKLTRHFTERGLRVATIKHTHHKFDIDALGSDTERHRIAGAAETAIVSGSRVAVIEEIETRGEPSLPSVASRLGPADIIFVEGYKSAAIPKIEVRRAAIASEKLLAASDPFVLAIAADHDVDGHGKPVFRLDDVVGIAALVEQTCGPFKHLRQRA